MQVAGVALVGAGFIADYHLGALRRLPGVALRAVVSRDAARARACADRFGVPDAGTSLPRLLARSDVDAVLVATPDDTHEAVASACLEAGKAVFLQKPMATDSAACRRLIALAAARSLDLQVSFMHRHFEEVEAARHWIASGALGTLNSVRLRNATPGPDWGGWFFQAGRVAGGVVLQLGTHGLDLIEHLFGPVMAVSARTATLVPRRRLASGEEVVVENPDSAWATYRLASGAVVSHEMSAVEAAGCDRFRMEIYGTEGTLWLRTERGRLAAFAPRRLGARGWFMPALPEAPLGERHHRRWLAGLTGAAPREETAQAGLRGLLIAEAIARSSAAGGAETAVDAT
ncbi:Gfo/Idh/MocA family protein [Falsiroseomonas sp. HW251]|uniref:Gfo/Idh/MocA family protein n=1 Tax=Falsiroseomonas sp. HW251 TaxID=3390998 RepID=UPI003D314C03